MPDAIDVVDLLGTDLSFAVAASNSARFPYVSAPGLLRAPDGSPRGQLVDGGFYDNNGALAARAAADALVRARGRLAARNPAARDLLLQLFIVQVISDPTLPPAEVPRCTPAPVAQAPKPAAPTPVDFLLSPIGTLISVRGKRSNAGSTELRRLQCMDIAGAPPAEPGVQRHYAVFSMGLLSLGGGPADIAAPLSWVLPDRVRAKILAEDLDGFPDAGNRQELGALGREWATAATAAARHPP